ncbi:MAG: hypothetical protein KKE51_08220 [Gammaproteobacteria bacterium]|nr:hypothetical protein [Gammaproteobacteria bacterium]MBU1602378.1 hypothetical protein [Gammaproteobacteria bacterium]MBU2433183.1 hypothetical protein [Gammaproteobacteria bacterium]MBU2451099.1 hypothetical protein [Gammaproteobacteria bacterium]
MNIEEQGILAQLKKPGTLTRAAIASGIAQIPILPEQRIGFADGGSLANGGITRSETADELMARMAAKYGAPSAGPVQQPAPVVQQPAPKPAPMQPATSIQGVMGILRGRKEAIDKAAGFANGGKISGPGTQTSDSIPAKVRETGEGILVSNQERIVSADQEKALQHVANSQGFESVDSMLAQMTGKPVGPTIKSAQRAAADGLSPETDPDTDGRRQYSPNYGDAFANRGGSFAPQGPSNGPDSILATPTIPGITTRSASAPDSLQSMTAPQGSMAVAKPEVREASGEHAPSSNQGITGIAALPAGRNEQGVITAESAQSVMGNPMTRSGGIAGSIDMAGVNGILARENQARGEMIDSSIKANGGNGIGILGGDTTAADNAEKTNRWALDDLRSAIKGAGSRTERTALGQALSQTIAGQNQQGAETIRQQGAIEQRGILAGIEQAKLSGTDQRAADRNRVQIRAQDLKATTAADRMDSQERIAEQRTQDAGTRLTLPQRRSNFEITAARKAVAGLTPDEIKHKTANYTATGRENPDYDPTLAKAVSLAGRRMYGDDAEFDQRQQKEQAQQPDGNDGDVTTRFRADAGMKGHTMGKQTDHGTEVLDASGKLIGHYK